jgi:enamine deaminase RidA (YjgF/YER057c/UK114 family)
MNITLLQPAGLVASPAFSHVAVVPAGATTIYVGGQNGVDTDGVVVSSDVAEQSTRALDNASSRSKRPARHSPMLCSGRC